MMHRPSDILAIYPPIGYEYDGEAPYTVCLLYLTGYAYVWDGWELPDYILAFMRFRGYRKIQHQFEKYDYWVLFHDKTHN